MHIILFLLDSKIKIVSITFNIPRTLVINPSFSLKQKKKNYIKFTNEYLFISGYVQFYNWSYPPFE